MEDSKGESLTRDEWVVYQQLQEADAHASWNGDLAREIVKAMATDRGMMEADAPMTCPGCGGDGGDFDDSTKPCDECGGSGKIGPGNDPYGRYARAAKIVKEVRLPGWQASRPMPTPDTRLLGEIGNCLVCGHEWERHDPEDGRCDAFAVDGSGVCQCGRDLAFHQKWNAYLSKMALGRLRTPGTEEDT